LVDSYLIIKNLGVSSLKYRRLVCKFLLLMIGYDLCPNGQDRPIDY